MEYTSDNSHLNHAKYYIYFQPSEMKWVFGRELFSDFNYDIYLEADVNSDTKGLDMTNRSVTWLRKEGLYEWKPDYSKTSWCSFDDEAYKGCKIEIKMLIF